ncbi:uncharacterized protein BDV17DRAFT_285832 [Aspergillus undulatus]|uniref:uncharacterized protein n=1 Tax=Aspergillus undulatus TaxID=1810928 RepID=UPI003CCD2D48
MTRTPKNHAQDMDETAFDSPPILPVKSAARFKDNRAKEDGKPPTQTIVQTSPSPVTAIIPGLFLSTKAEALDETQLKLANAIAVLLTTMAADSSATTTSVSISGLPGTDSNRKVIQLKDCQTQDLLKYFAEISDFIERVAPRRLRGVSR